MSALLVALGAAVGASLRYLAGHFLDRRTPWGTALVNVLGSFLLGVFVARGVGEDPLLLLGTGFCGAFTTYSAFAVQSVDAGRRRGPVYALGTVLGCALAAWLGLQVG